MIRPNKQEFIELSKKGNLIPVYKELQADTETPVSAFKKITSGENDYAFLLESVEGGEKFARYSFLGADPEKVLKLQNTDDPFVELKKEMAKYKPVLLPGLPRFHGGLVGHLNYDIVHHIEDIPNKNKDEQNIPDVEFLLTDTLLVFDHVKHKIIIISNAHIEGSPEIAYEKAIKKIAQIEKKLKTSLKIKELEASSKPKKPLNIRSNFTKQEFMKVVERAKEYIKAGDVIQVVPSQRFETKFTGDAFDVYRMLRIINPSPYMFYLKFKGTTLVGSSPEVLVRLEGNIAVVRPIAGTSPRGANDLEDKNNEKKLLASEKEKAEHVMLIDLARNDLGRVCEKSTVKVDELMVVERYSHVMHIVSNVVGRLKPDEDAFSLLKASFPAGTVSGAPKVRAMEIIDELENTKRGVYAGAVGYFSYSGEMDTCIAIRTLVIKDKKAYIQAGAGIVADSDPASEYEETVNKAKAMLKALELAQ